MENYQNRRLNNSRQSHRRFSTYLQNNPPTSEELNQMSISSHRPTHTSEYSFVPNNETDVSFHQTRDHQLHHFPVQNFGHMASTNFHTNQGLEHQHNFSNYLNDFQLLNMDLSATPSGMRLRNDRVDHFSDLHSQEVQPTRNTDEAAASRNQISLRSPEGRRLQEKAKLRKKKRIDFFNTGEGQQLRLQTGHHSMVNTTGERFYCALCGQNNGAPFRGHRSSFKCDVCDVYLCRKQFGYSKSCYDTWHTVQVLSPRQPKRQKTKSSSNEAGSSSKRSPKNTQGGSSSKDNQAITKRRRKDGSSGSSHK